MVRNGCHLRCDACGKDTSSEASELQLECPVWIVTFTIPEEAWEASHKQTIGILNHEAIGLFMMPADRSAHQCGLASEWERTQAWLHVAKDGVGVTVIRQAGTFVLASVSYWAVVNLATKFGKDGLTPKAVQEARAPTCGLWGK
jgi:hypothetical protein